MNRKKSIALIVAILGIILASSGCSKLFAPSKPPDRTEEEKPVVSLDNDDKDLDNQEEEDDDVEGKVFQLDTLEKENRTAKKLALSAAVTSDIADIFPLAEKLSKRGLSNPADLPEAYSFLYYAYQTEMGKDDNWAKEIKKDAVTTEQVNKLLKETYSDATLIKALPLALQETDFYNKEGSTYDLSPGVSPSHDLGSFSLAYEETTDSITAKITPTEGSPQAEELEYLEYSFDKIGDNFHLISAHAETVPEKKDKLGTAVDITDKLTEAEFTDYTIIGSINSSPIGIEYWDGTLTIAAMDSRFNIVKTVTFEKDMPKFTFRGNNLHVKFPTEIHIFDENLNIVFNEKIPQFLQEYYNAFPNPQYEKNTARNLEFYDYDISNDYAYYLYASGYGTFIYNKDTELQVKVIDSVVSGNVLQTPFKVRFSLDNRYAYGYVGGGAKPYVRYDLTNHTVEELTYTDVAATALTAQHGQMGDFFNPAITDLISIGKNYYVSGAGSSFSVGLLSNSSSFDTMTKPLDDAKLSALLDDGRLIFNVQKNGETHTYFTPAPNVAPPTNQIPVEDNTPSLSGGETSGVMESKPRSQTSSADDDDDNKLSNPDDRS